MSNQTYGLMNYISQQGQNRVKEFKYQGGSVSLLYGNLWSPLCDFLVKKVVPSNIAPNLITISGFFPLLIAHLLFLYYCPDVSAPVPTWLLVYSGFAVLTYQLLDNLDGKQARATQNSSPLGMLFDHGLDTLTAWIVGYMVMCTLRMGNNNMTFYAIFFIPQVTFYFAMWAQYHAGAFQLGYINGIDEGLVVIQVLMFSSAYLGQDFFTNTNVPYFNIPLNYFIFYFNSMLSIFQVLDFARQTYLQVRGRIFSCARSLWLCVILMETVYLVANYSPQRIVQQHFYLVFIGMSFTVSGLITHLQFAYLTKSKFSQKNIFYLLPMGLLNINYMWSYFHAGEILIPEYPLIVGIALFAFLQYSHMVYSVFMQISTVLDIKIFKINKPQTK